MPWQTATATKVFNCDCCSEEVPFGVSYLRLKHRVINNWKTNCFCVRCGQEIRQGKSFSEVRKTEN